MVTFSIVGVSAYAVYLIRTRLGGSIFGAQGERRRALWRSGRAVDRSGQGGSRALR